MRGPQSEQSQLIEEHRPKSASFESRVPLLDIESLSSKPFKTLVVDDSDMNRKIMSRLLNKSKTVIFDIFEANDGITAVEYIAESMKPDASKFEFVFMDNVMIEMNGPEAARNMRKLGDIIFYHFLFSISFLFNNFNQ